MIRGRIIYTLINERGEKLGYVGRDPNFEQKQTKWENSDRESQAPVKTKYPPGFLRGSFLYGAVAKRMQQPGIPDQLQDSGLIVCEGFNESILLSAYGIAAISLGSNRVAEGQIEKLVRWSHSMANGRVSLFLDNNKEGWEGTKATLEKLALHVHVRTVWTPHSFAGKYSGKEPEQLKRSELIELFEPISHSGVIIDQIKAAEGVEQRDEI